MKQKKNTLNQYCGYEKLFFFSVICADYDEYFMGGLNGCAEAAPYYGCDSDQINGLCCATCQNLIGIFCFIFVLNNLLELFKFLSKIENKTIFCIS